VDAAHTRSKDKKPKTGEARTVELNSRALAVMKHQQALTQLAGGHVFPNAEGQPFASTDGPLGTWWKPALKLTGMRYRDARQTRHTYATLCLHAGLTPAWAAQQLGHSVEMFYRVYSKWIEGADKGVERKKLDAFIGAATGTQTGT
jgi:integrase